MSYPVMRWWRGLRRVTAGSPAQVPVYLTVSPLIACGHLATAAGAWRERAALRA